MLTYYINSPSNHEDFHLNLTWTQLSSASKSMTAKSKKFDHNSIKAFPKWLLAISDYVLPTWDYYPTRHEQELYDTISKLSHFDMEKILDFSLTVNPFCQLSYQSRSFRAWVYLCRISKDFSPPMERFSNCWCTTYL